MRVIVLGTRGSQLALAQAELVQNRLAALPDPPPTEIRVVRTVGDQRLDLRLADSGLTFSKGLFTKELELALLAREIDVAVHSLKDLPTDLPDGLILAAVLPRHDPIDLLIAKTAEDLSKLPAGALVATSSPRRSAQLRHLRPDLQVVEVRGNVGTRLKKLLEQPAWDALILAKAGLERLHFDLSGHRLKFAGTELYISELAEMLPAVGQGAIALEALRGAPEMESLWSAVNDPATWFCTEVEREFLRRLGGGCQMPLGIRTLLTAGELHAEAIVFEPDGRARSGSVRGRFANEQAAAAALLQKVYER